MVRSPSSSRRRLGAELKALRDAAGLRVEDAAEALECSTAKISRLENGKGRPFQRDVRDLLQLYGQVSRARENDLYGLVAAGREEDWIDDYRDVLQGERFYDHLAPESGGRFVTLERDASALKQFESDYVPGLLQTEEYIDTVCRYVFPNKTAGERARFVALRAKRQDVVLRQQEHPDVQIVVSEATIVRRIVSPDILVRQLQALIDDLRGALHWIDFRMTLLADEPAAALGGPFYIIRFADAKDQDTVYLEGREESDYLDSDDDVARYEKTFDALLATSLSRADSLERIAEEMAKAFR